MALADDPPGRRSDGYVTPAPRLHDGPDRCGVADPGIPAAARKGWRSPSSIPGARGEQGDSIYPARRLCLGLDAARSAAWADGLSALARLAPRWPLAAEPRSPPRPGPPP